MRIKKRKLPTIFDIKAVGQAIEDTPGALAYWGFQNQPPERFAPAWNRAKAGVLSSDNYPGADIIVNGNFVNWTGIPPADSPDNWIDTQVGDATSNITQNPAGHCQIISNGVLTRMRQVVLTIGVRYRVVIEVTDVTLGSIKISDGFAGAPVINAVGTYIYEGVATSTSFYIGRSAACNVTISNATCSLANPLNLDLVSVTIGEPGQGNIPYVYDFDAINDYATFSAPGITALDAIFDGDEMSLMVWADVDNWTTGPRSCISWQDDATNNMILNVTAVNGQFRYLFEGGGTTQSVLHATGSPAGLNLYTMTRSLAADTFIAYLNNAQAGATQNGIVAWTGAGFDIAVTKFGSIDNVPAWPFGGGMAFAALFDQPITQAQNNNIYEAGR